MVPNLPASAVMSNPDCCCTGRRHNRHSINFICGLEAVVFWRPSKAVQRDASLAHSLHVAALARHHEFPLAESNGRGRPAKHLRGPLRGLTCGAGGSDWRLWFDRVCQVSSMLMSSSMPLLHARVMETAPGIRGRTSRQQRRLASVCPATGALGEALNDTPNMDSGGNADVS